MPYRIEKRRGGAKPYKIVNAVTGQQVGSSSSRSKAEASVRARVSAEGGQILTKGGNTAARRLARKRRKIAERKKRRATGA